MSGSWRAEHCWVLGAAVPKGTHSLNWLNSDFNHVLSKFDAVSLAKSMP